MARPPAAPAPAREHVPPFPKQRRLVIGNLAGEHHAQIDMSGIADRANWVTGIGVRAGAVQFGLLQLPPLCKAAKRVHDHLPAEYEADLHYCSRPEGHAGRHICHCGTGWETA